MSPCPSSSSRSRLHSRWRSGAGRLLAAGTLAVGVSACERGCLSARLVDQAGSPGLGGEGPRGSRGRDGASRDLDLGGTDCSDGLARCVAGRVETSVAGHVPHPCTPRDTKGSCECAWQAAGPCEAGCVEDHLEIVAQAEVARVQLCAPATPALRPLVPAESAAPPICAGESASCVDGIVRVCTAAGQPARLLGACVGGCAAGVGMETGDLLANAGVAAVLCRHASSHAP